MRSSSAYRRTLGAGLAAIATFTLGGTAIAQKKPAPVPGASFDFASWDQYLSGGDSSQYSSLDQINKTNVAKLQVAWTFPTGPGASPHFNPIIVRNVMYIAVGDAVVALDPATGKELWRHKGLGRIGQRGMNYWESKDGKDRRLLFVADGNLRAVNAENGDPVATFGTDGKVDLRVGLAGDITKVRALQTDNPGRVYKDIIVMSLPAGSASYASAPADIHAYDIRTGKLLWVFHTVPQKGEFGYETWPDVPDHDKIGGIHNWSESTVDQELGIVYIPTGTARYDFYGGNRKGNNLFANSILALDARTGKRLWHFQAIHHDLWDYDFPQAPKLLTITRDGKQVPILVQASKQGFVYVLDRRTGAPIWPIEERPVPKSDVPGEQASPTQPFPTWPKPFARQKFTEDQINPYLPQADKDKVHALFKTARNEGLYTPPSLQGTISMPGHNGGANWGTSAVDPVKGRFFVMAKQLPTFDKLTLDTKPQSLANMPNAGGDVQPYQGGIDFMLQSNSLSAIGPPWSTITAYDMNSGDILWQVPNGDILPLEQLGIDDTGSHAPRGSPVITAGGLMFIGTSSDRKLRARDTDTGKVLWEANLGAASEGAPAVYQAGGREFIVVPVGGIGLFANARNQPPAGPNQYVAFALPDAGAGK